MASVEEKTVLAGKEESARGWSMYGFWLGIERLEYILIYVCTIISTFKREMSVILLS